jgi:hypothetical protein
VSTERRSVAETRQPEAKKRRGPPKPKLSFNLTEGILIGGQLMDNLKDEQLQSMKNYYGLGASLAKDVREYWILKTRLDIKDKKKVFKIKEDFMKDCQINLGTFEVHELTDFFTRKEDEGKLVSGCLFYLCSKRLFAFSRKVPRPGRITSARN